MLVLAHKHTSKTAITTSNKVKMTSPLSPDVPISHHFPKGKQTGPCTCSTLSLPGQGAPPSGVSPPLAPTGSRCCARPGRPSRWLCVPGGGALRSRRPPRRSGLGCGWARSLRGRPAAAAPPPRPPGLRSPPSCPGGAAASAARARGPASEPKGQIWFHNKVSSSPQSNRRPTPPAARAGRELGRDEGGQRARPGRVAGARAGSWTHGCPQLGDAGLRNRFFQKQTENG